ncbi:MAG: glycosyltransferase family 9 protein [bacterium]
MSDQIQTDDSILLIRLSAIGDAVRGLPLARYLRKNGFKGTIGWAAHPPIDGLLNEWDEIDRVHPVRRELLPFHPVRYWDDASECQDYEYDWVFDLHGLLKSSLVSLASGGPRRIGFHRTNSKEFNFLFQNETIGSLPESLPRILKYIQLCRPFIEESVFTRESIQPSQPTFSIQDNAIKEAAKETPVLIHPRTSHDRYGRKKEWGITNYTLLANELLPLIDNPILITWGPNEHSTADAIARQFDSRVRVAPKTGKLSEFAYLIQNARLVICGDTAPCHMADVMGVPLVTLFGSSDHEISAPMLTNYRYLTGRGDEQATSDIPVSRVSKAVHDLIHDL